MTKENPTTPTARLASVCVRLTDRERAKLEKRASDAELSLSTYMREYLLSDDNPVDLLPHETRQRLLAQILAGLGCAEYAKSLTALSDAARFGLLILSPDDKAIIAAACTQIEDMHHTLLRALGLRPGDRP